MSEKDEFFFKITKRYAGIIDTDLMIAVCYALNLTTEEFVVGGAYQRCLYELDIHNKSNLGFVINTIKVYTDKPRQGLRYDKHGIGYVSDVIFSYLTYRDITVKIPTASHLGPHECTRVFTRLCLYLYGCYGDHPRYRNLTPKQVIDMKAAIEELNQDLHDSGSELINKVRSHVLKNYIIESTVRDDSIICDTDPLNMMLDYCNEKGYTELTMAILRIIEEEKLNARQEQFRL